MVRDKVWRVKQRAKTLVTFKVLCKNNNKLVIAVWPDDLAYLLTMSIRICGTLPMGAIKEVLSALLLHLFQQNSSLLELEVLRGYENGNISYKYNEHPFLCGLEKKHISNMSHFQQNVYANRRYVQLNEQDGK